MIFITGDLHGEIDMHKLSMAAFPEQKAMTKDDYVIICGDFGCVWDGGKRDAYLLRQLTDKNFTTLFVDGNHENFPLLQQYPSIKWHGGLAHQITPSVLHLMRGQVFQIGKYKCFTMGGASSHDKMYRREGISWWTEELPSVLECECGFANLEMADNQVDIIITHCLPDSLLPCIDESYGHDLLTNYLEVVKQITSYTQWFCGHYHVNKRIDDKHVCLYEQIIRIE